MSQVSVNKVQPYDWSLGESLKPCVNSEPKPLNLFVFREIGWEVLSRATLQYPG